MQGIQLEVYEKIKPYFSCDRRRTKLISQLIISLLKLTDSSLSKWSKRIDGGQSLAAKYKELQRFARWFRFSPKLYAQVVWGLFGQDQQVCLTLDRTEWQMRGRWVQVLLVGIAHQGVSIPLLWQARNQQGNSPATTRWALLATVKGWLPIQEGQSLCWLIASSSAKLGLPTSTSRGCSS